MAALDIGRQAVRTPAAKRRATRLPAPWDLELEGESV